MKLSETNKALANKVADVQIPDCPISRVQVADDWVKLQFRKHPNRTFLLRPDFPADMSYKQRSTSDSAPRGAENEIRRKSGAKRPVLVVKRPPEDEAALAAKAIDSVKEFTAEMAGLLRDEASVKTLTGYGDGADIGVIYQYTAPDPDSIVHTDDGKAYYPLGRFDAQSGAELWAPAFKPPMMAARLIPGGKTGALNEDESPARLDEADTPLPDFDAEEGGPR